MNQLKTSCACILNPVHSDNCYIKERSEVFSYPIVMIYTQHIELMQINNSGFFIMYASFNTFTKIEVFKVMKAAHFVLKLYYLPSLIPQRHELNIKEEFFV